MIARLWHGRVPTVKADAYYAYLRRTGLADYAATPGNRGVSVLRRTEGSVTHFLLLTFWESLAALEAFAGPAHEVARYYPEDDEYLLEREPFVTHYEVLASSANDEPPDDARGAEEPDDREHRNGNAGTAEPPLPAW